MTDKMDNDALEKVAGGQFDMSITKVARAKTTTKVYTVLDTNSQVRWTYAAGDSVTVYPDSFIDSWYGDPWIYVQSPGGIGCTFANNITGWQN